MTYSDIIKNIAQTKIELAETAITTPYLFHEYQAWQGAKLALPKAQADLEKAASAWSEIIHPALKLPSFAGLAQQKGPIP
jgi:hypothetical protein